MIGSGVFDRFRCWRERGGGHCAQIQCRPVALHKPKYGIFSREVTNRKDNFNSAVPESAGTICRQHPVLTCADLSRSLLNRSMSIPDA